MGKDHAAERGRIEIVFHQTQRFQFLHAAADEREPDHFAQFCGLEILGLNAPEQAQRAEAGLVFQLLDLGERKIEDVISVRPFCCDGG